MAMIPVSVASVSFVNSGFVVFLREEQGERTLPIFVGLLEARSIAGELANEVPPRPMTHDLFKNVLQTLECSLLRVEVCDLVDNTFYGRLVIECKGSSMEIDSRPSDAIALALRFSAPIFVDEKVMDEAGVVLQEEEEQPEEGQESAMETTEMSQLDTLKAQLNAAISSERYEEAARIRDEIARITKATDSN